MRTTYYVASSLDRFIAGPQGELDWLPMDVDYGFHDFLASVDGVAMGARTYEMIRRFGKWPYGDLPGWVFANAPEGPALPEVQFVSGPVRPVLDQIEGAGVGHLWLVGGGTLARSFVDEGAVDEWRLFVIPIVLGSGIPLLAGESRGKRTELDFAGERSFENGVVELRYRRPA